jgi:hypothetical protein
MASSDITPKSILHGNCKYCGIKLLPTNVTFSKKGYLASGRVCNVCRGRLYKFYIAKPFLVSFMKKLNMTEDQIYEAIENERQDYIKSREP